MTADGSKTCVWRQTIAIFEKKERKKGARGGVTTRELTHRDDFLRDASVHGACTFCCLRAISNQGFSRRAKAPSGVSSYSCRVEEQSDEGRRGSRSSLQVLISPRIITSSDNRIDTLFHHVLHPHLIIRLRSFTFFLGFALQVCVELFSRINRLDSPSFHTRRLHLDASLQNHSPWGSLASSRSTGYVHNAADHTLRLCSFSERRCNRGKKKETRMKTPDGFFFSLASPESVFQDASPAAASRTPFADHLSSLLFLPLRLRASSRASSTASSTSWAATRPPMRTLAPRCTA